MSKQSQFERDFQIVDGVYCVEKRNLDGAVADCLRSGDWERDKGSFDECREHILKRVVEVIEDEINTKAGDFKGKLHCAFRGVFFIVESQGFTLGEYTTGNFLINFFVRP